MHNPLALTERAELVGLTAQNVVDTVGFTAAVLQQIRQRALANFSD